MKTFKSEPFSAQWDQLFIGEVRPVTEARLFLGSTLLPRSGLLPSTDLLVMLDTLLVSDLLLGSGWVLRPDLLLGQTCY